MSLPDKFCALACPPNISDCLFPPSHAFSLSSDTNIRQKSLQQGKHASLCRRKKVSCLPLLLQSTPTIRITTCYSAVCSTAFTKRCSSLFIARKCIFVDGRAAECTATSFTCAAPEEWDPCSSRDCWCCESKACKEGADATRDLAQLAE